MIPTQLQPALLAVHPSVAARVPSGGGTLLGALLISTIRNGLNLFGAGNDIQYIVIGLVIIVAVTIDVFRGKMEAKARKMAMAD